MSALDRYRVAPSRYCLARGVYPLLMRSVVLSDMLADAEPDSWICGDRACTVDVCRSWSASATAQPMPSVGVDTRPGAAVEGIMEYPR